MTTMTLQALPDASQRLVDSRLDTIERMLIGRVPRSDRIAIVQEVESQIYELLGERDSESITPENVIQILRQLDPPEAYMANQELVSNEAPVFSAQQRFLPLATKLPQQPLQTAGRIGGIMAISSFALVVLAVPLLWLVAVLFDSEEILLFGLAMLAFVGIGVGIAGLVMSIQNRRQGTLPILGIVTSALSLPIWLIGCPMVILSAL